jgi:hypothetical protein
MCLEPETILIPHRAASVTRRIEELVDVKGVETDVFKIKRKLLLALYPNVILRVIPA